MKLGNLACGAVRPQGEEWWNVDALRSVLAPGTPERQQLDSEPRYIEANLETEGVPFEDGSMDSLLLSHALEHFDCRAGVKIMRDCHRVLKPGGVLLVSVPDASYFRKVHHEDTAENAERLFGEPIFAGDGETTFFGYGLWNRHHKAILSEDTLWAYFRRAGFRKCGKVEISTETLTDPAWFASSGTQTNFEFPEEIAEGWNEGAQKACGTMVPLLNRLPFSLVMAAQKE